MASHELPDRPVRIMNISGSPADRREALLNATKSDETIDVVVGDWMSEFNMPTRAYAVTHDGVGYEETFLEALEPALENLAQKKMKLAANAGTTATKQLYQVVVEMVQKKGLDLTVAWVEGDVLDPVQVTHQSDGSIKDLIHISSGQNLQDWGYEPFFAQCYLGGMGIWKALDAGADIVICGRVADASPIVAAAAWWHSWERTDFDKLAQALMAGHLIECSTYVTGGNFTGFKSLDWSGITDMGYPIAEIAYDGDVVITKPQGTGGIVSVETCKEQLLYEIQGTYYLNCDVTAIIDQVQFAEIGQNRVRMSGVRGQAPPSTTKVGLTAHGGYRSELHWAVVGLDIEEKVRMLETQVRASYGEKMAMFSNFSFQLYGSVPQHPETQDAATLHLRIVAEAKSSEAFTPKNFARPTFDIIMNTFPAATMTLRTPVVSPFQEYFPTLIPQPTVTVHFSQPDKKDIEVTPAEVVLKGPVQQPTYEAIAPLPLSTFGVTTQAPLGHVVLGRAGDKGSNCNVGFFVRNADEWSWLQSLLSTEKFIELMGKDYKGQKIDRMEFPHLWAVHFLLHNHLDRGVCANSTYDTLGKFLCEYIRCKTVDVPVTFLERGKV
ncbi:DUF1446-domain-containing protein [Penicillium taxi]|uniref:DUF1446-domain-containing protein n=1 Tax=Penicillium taxi TaxID=168475 RepID=UPI0025455611|nr:DUF1446-domain-containing protein [Penicillium taxi]KAJ5901921.1 DUF1446-domain-containing protein [Penicillium taxi]